MSWYSYKLVKRFCEELGGDLKEEEAGYFSCSVELKTKKDYERFAKFLGMEYKEIGDKHVLRTPLETITLDIPRGEVVKVEFDEWDIDFFGEKGKIQSPVTLSMEATIEKLGAIGGRLYIDSEREIFEDGKRSKPLTVEMTLRAGYPTSFILSAGADIEAERKELPRHREMIRELVKKMRSVEK